MIVHSCTDDQLVVLKIVFELHDQGTSCCRMLMCPGEGSAGNSERNRVLEGFCSNIKSRVQGFISWVFSSVCNSFLSPCNHLSLNLLVTGRDWENGRNRCSLFSCNSFGISL
ncbi:hypothetical protein QL285_096801 [Trifolium repens]|nr:hypothetical protein QL285_096801 [Trifolium repens]